MKKILLILLILFTVNSHSQKKILVLDTLNKNQVEYATIKFIGVNDGTYANENGYFLIPENIKEFIVSSVGYKSQTFKNLKEIDTIYLKQMSIQLESINISKRKKEIIDKNKSETYISFNSNSESIIFAKRFDFKSDIKISKIHMDIKNDNKKRNFRLLIYKIDKNGLPKNNIITKNIIKSINPNQENLSFDLNDSEIFLNKDSYFLAIEIFDLKKDNINSSLKIGCYKTSKINYSLSKPVFNDDEKWKSIKSFNKKKEYSFNFYLTIESVY